MQIQLTVNGRFANPAALAALGYDCADELLERRSHETIHRRYTDWTPHPAAECPVLRSLTTAVGVAHQQRRLVDLPHSLRDVRRIPVDAAQRIGRGEHRIPAD
jgi:PAS domain-containing protein